MRILDSAVNHTTRSGAVLGTEQRLRPMDALKAMTVWPVYQNFEKESILDQDPLSIDPSKIATIIVVETIKRDVSVYVAV